MHDWAFSVLPRVTVVRGTPRGLKEVQGGLRDSGRRARGVEGRAEA